GVEIDFFMPRTREPVSVSWMNVIQVDFSSFSEFGAAAVFGGESEFREFGPYRDFCRKELKAVRLEKGVVSPSGVDEAMVSPAGLGFFEAVNKYNSLCAKLVALYHCRRKYDLVHCHDWITFRAGEAVALECGVPWVATVHSTEYDRTGNLWPFEWILGIERRGVRAADLVLAVSNRTAEQLVERFGADRRRLRVFYNAIDVAPFANKAFRREDFGFPADSKIVLYNARLSVQKGPEVFLRAAARVLEKEPRARFVVSGSGDLLPRLTELAVDLGIAGKVRFVGFTPFCDIPVLYAVSDVYVLPSVSEPFGITVLEAMASGTPVIVSKTSGVSEVVKNCLTVDFWDVDGIASRVLGVLKYAVLKQVLGEGGREEARGLSWDKTASDVKWFYGQAIAGLGGEVVG
ncbi:TPA: glycosyltransferase family 4 protein, partial [Candidatus Micrarchaeota archaeon]|nr:glycosyltransferase family 4 protein [Candidatus Micrarchaeota archaeon]